MKKKVLCMALAAIVSIGISSFAQSPDNNCSAGSNKNCVVKDMKCCGKKKDCKEKCDNNCSRKCVNPFEGLNLTEQQKSALANIPNPRQVMKAARDNNKGKKESPEMRRDVARNVMLDYLKQVKGVLTHEQYMQFLENSYVNGRLNMAGKPGKGHHDSNKGKGKSDCKGGHHCGRVAGQQGK